MKYALIIDKVVTQVQLKPRDGFVPVSDDVVCGQIQDGDSFTNPPAPEPSPLEQAHDAAAQVFASLPLGIQALWEPVRAKVAESILAGDFTKAREILETTPVIYKGAEKHRDEFLKLLAK